MVGAIIGKGGAKINEIRHLSGSVIKINEPQDNSNERLVTITGTQECNQMALYMLYSRLGAFPFSCPFSNLNIINLPLLLQKAKSIAFEKSFRPLARYRSRVTNSDWNVEQEMQNRADGNSQKFGEISNIWKLQKPFRS
jgi:hypothetical protein